MMNFVYFMSACITCGFVGYLIGQHFGEKQARKTFERWIEDYKKYSKK